MTDQEKRWEDDDDDSHHRSRYNNGNKQDSSSSANGTNTTSTTTSTTAAATTNTTEEDEPVDEFGRPLRPGRESSDSDSDHDYRNYRRRSRGDRRDNRYSPDNRSGRKRDHSPSSNGPDKRNRGDTSPRDYRDRGDRNDRDRRRRDDWNERSNEYNGRQSITTRNGRGDNNDQQRSTSPSKSQSSTGTSRRQKRGDIFEGGVFKTYKQFLDYQDDSITPTDAEKKYEEYKIEFSKRQARVFFKDHQTEEWFREKYDPVFLVKKRKEKIEFAKSRVAGFVTMFEDENFNFNLTAKDNIKDSDKLNHEGMDEHDMNEHEHTDENHHNENEEKLNNDSNSSNSNTTTTTTSTSTTASNTNKNNTLFIKAISPTCTKDDLLEVLNKVGNEEEPTVVTKLTLSEPMKYKNFYRLGWVTFKNSEFAMKALKELNGTKMRDFELFLTINKQVQIDTQKKFRITPKIASTEQRITTDLKQAIDIAKNLDQDREITNNPLWIDQFESMSEMDRLDRTIHYLRHVHLFCYYCSEEYSDIDEIERKCGSVHLRRPLGDDFNTTTTTTKSNENDENESNNTNNNNEQSDQMEIDQKPSEENTWVTNLDNNIKAKIAKINNQEQYTCKHAIEKSAEEFIQINTFKMEEEKFRCSLCCKLFKGSEYVKKHINLKHPEELKEDSVKKGTEEQFFLNYFSDPRRMTPPTQQQLLYYQNPRGMIPGMPPRPRWNPTLGTWESQMVIPQMIPAMIPSTPPISIAGQMYPVSPLFTSPNVRGRGGLPLPIPMRRGAFPQPVVGASASTPTQAGGVLPSPTNVRYRPYPSSTPQQQPRTVTLPPADPRGIREYVDLDAAPTGSMPEIDYTAALKQYQNKKTTQ